MEVGKLELYVGGMYAEKSTNLVRQGKRHMMAGRKVVMLKPNIDGRYGNDVVATHDGQKMEAINVMINDFMNYCDDFSPSSSHPAIIEADVICIDEIQFFPPLAVKYINELIYAGKLVYAAGLDMDKTGKPFETTMALMGRAEVVKKFQAVCRDCGNDSWVTVETKPQVGRVNVGNDYKPVCRPCSVKYIGGAAK